MPRQKFARLVNMVQDFVQALYGWVLTTAGVVRDVLWVILLTAFAGAALWLAYRRLDPEDSAARKPKLKSLGAAAWRLGRIALAVLLLCGVLVQARKMVALRRAAVDQASASRHNEPQLSGVVQYAPSVAFVQDRTYSRTLTLPPNFLDRIGADGVQVLAPYLSDPSAADVLKMVDSFKRSGKDVVFTRELTRRDEVPIAADGADVQVNFENRGAPSGQRHFEVTFEGVYTFHNPRPEAATMKFNFPPPQGGGTTQGFYFDAAGQHVTEPDEHGLYVWTGTVPPSGQVKAVAHYRVTGGGAYNYMLGSERRRIGDFHMKAASPQELKFGKTGIYPTRVSGAEAEWQLKDVLTAQSIELQFSRTDLQAQLLDKTLSILPLALVVFATGVFAFVAGPALRAVLAFGVGLIAIPVLSAYLSPTAATLAGAVFAIVAAGVMLRSTRGWVVAATSGLLAIAFLTVEHGSLVAWLLVVGVIILTQLGNLRTRNAVAT